MLLMRKVVGNGLAWRLYHDQNEELAKGSHNPSSCPPAYVCHNKSRALMHINYILITVTNLPSLFLVAILH